MCMSTYMRQAHVEVEVREQLCEAGYLLPPFHLSMSHSKGLTKLPCEPDSSNSSALSAGFWCVVAAGNWTYTLLLTRVGPVFHHLANHLYPKFHGYGRKYSSKELASKELPGSYPTPYFTCFLCSFLAVSLFFFLLSKFIFLTNKANIFLETET